MRCLKHILKLSKFPSFASDINHFSPYSILPNIKPRKEKINKTAFPTESVVKSDFYFEDGLRKVYPFYYHHTMFCKGRWIGKTVVDAYSDEFALFTREEYGRRIERGVFKVNGKVVDKDYKLRNADLMSADLHKHELPVLACPIETIFENEDFFVIDKPPSLAVHPCGLYMKNSLLAILASEYNKTNLYITHRLDRLTSGVLVFVKSSEKSKELHDEMNLRSIRKEYICRVEANFPDGTVLCNKPIKQFHHKIGVCLVHSLGKVAVTEFKKLSYNGKSSVVLCKPHTGRTHQIRVHLQYLGHPIINDPLYNSKVFGLLKGKNGATEKPVTELLEELLAEHSSEWCLEKTYRDRKTNFVQQNKYLNFAIFKEYYSKYSENSSYEKDKSRISYDKDCYFCSRTPYHDPVQNHLGIFLHALKYEGEKWSFSSKLPFWASEDWTIA